MTCDLEHCKTLISNPNKKLKILSQNIRSINHNLPGFMTILHRSAIDWDIIVLTECWLSKVSNVPNFDGYNHCATTHNRTQNEGVIIYTKDSLNTQFDEPIFLEANCITAKINNTTLIISIYRPPAHSNISNFLQSLNNILITATNFQNIIICGDINIDIKTDTKDRNSSLYLDLLAFHGFLPAHTLPTHINSCLDHFILKTKFNAQVLIAQTTLTDHYTTMLCLAQNFINNNNKINSYTKINTEALATDIINIDFNPLYKIQNVNTATDLFISLIQQVITSNTTTITTSKRRRILKPWITPGLLRCMRNRDNLHKKCTQSPNNDVLKTTYIRYRNFCNQIVRKTKQNYEKNEIKKAGSNNKKLWQVINSISNRSKQKKVATELITPLQSVNDVNNFFGNIGSCLANKITDDPNFIPNTSPINSPPSSSMSMLPTDSEEIEAIISNLKRDCAIGWDDISSNFIIEYKNILTPPITYICNLSLISGIFPTLFKKSLIHPIHKTGDKGTINNYRPISILPALSKILERLLNNRLVSYLEDNNLLSSCQFGFRIGKSTDDAVHQLTNFVVDNMDRKQKTLAVFLDLTKAFDTVSIPLLLIKMENLGIRGTQLQLFKDYLINRTQCVKIGTHISDDFPISHGVPQGSILGPTLFLIFINELCDLKLPNAKILTFADDTALLFSNKTWHEVYHSAQSGLNIVTTWLQQNILTLNANKSRYITFSMKQIKRSSLDSLDLVVHSCFLRNSVCKCPKLAKTDCYKYLGILIDDKLSFQPHVNILSNRIRKLIYVFKTLRHVADGNIIKSVYFSLCQSLIMYCISSWGGTTKTNLIKLERAQRTILKVCTFRPYRYPTFQLYQYCQVLTVRQLFILNTVLKQHSSEPFNPSLYSSKRTNIFSPKQLSTSFAQRFFMFLGIFLYNRINNQIQIYPLSRNECKRKLTMWLMNYNYDDTEEMINVIG